MATQGMLKAAEERKLRRLQEQQEALDKHKAKGEALKAVKPLERVRLLRHWVDPQGCERQPGSFILVLASSVEGMVAQGIAERPVGEEEMLLNLLDLHGAGLLFTADTPNKLLVLARQRGIPVERAKDDKQRGKQRGKDRQKEA